MSNDPILDEVREAKWKHAECFGFDVRAIGADVMSSVTEARHKVGLSQAQFAGLLGVSKRTLQDWEQGRREPSGAAKSLLKIAEKRPDVLREIFG